MQETKIHDVYDDDTHANDAYANEVSTDATTSSDENAGSESNANGSNETCFNETSVHDVRWSYDDHDVNQQKERLSKSCASFSGSKKTHAGNTADAVPG